MYHKVVAVPRMLCCYGEAAPLPDPVLSAARQALTAHFRPGGGRAVPPGYACTGTGGTALPVLLRP